jgi:ABC-type transport system involved in cytochrome bd biosynthesis fused ATPase/permease subunit
MVKKQLLDLAMVSSALVLVHFVKRQWNRLHRPELARIVQMLILQPEIFSCPG